MKFMRFVSPTVARMITPPHVFANLNTLAFVDSASCPSMKTLLLHAKTNHQILYQAHEGKWHPLTLSSSLINLSTTSTTGGSSSCEILRSCAFI